MCELTDTTFKTEVENANIPVVVDFWAPWCAPCRTMLPIIEKLATEYDNKLKICKLNVEENQQIAVEYSVRGVPTFIVFKEGKPVKQFSGAMPEEEFRKKLDELV